MFNRQAFGYKSVQEAINFYIVEKLKSTVNLSLYQQLVCMPLSSIGMCVVFFSSSALDVLTSTPSPNKYMLAAVVVVNLYYTEL